MPKTPLQILNERAQSCVASFPVVILGSGSSIAAGIPGMKQLRDHLLEMEITNVFSSKLDSVKWDEFIEALKKMDLEAALHQANLPEHLDDRVVEATWNFLHPFDIQVFNSMLRRSSPHPLTLLFQHLLRSTNHDLNVVTPNYDRIAEYAADLGQLYHETGFSYGHLRWRLGDNRQSVQIAGRDCPRINIHKVHGSFDWFRDDQGAVTALPVSYPMPSGWKPAIVTPGLRKYQRTYEEPFVSIKTASDRAFSGAAAFFCSGFGFNDSHIQTKIKERFRIKQVPFVLITYEATQASKEFVRSALCSQYLIVESAPGGCRMFSPEFPDGETIEGPEYWKLEFFLNLITP